MSSHLLNRVVVRDKRPVVGVAQTPIETVLGRFENGEPGDAVCAAAGLEPLDLIAAIAHDALSDPEGLSLTQSNPRRPQLLSALKEPALVAVLPKMPRPTRLGLAAGLLQIHNFWDASHAAAQEADDLGESRVSEYWHAIAHRREPDPGNASYWFRRVGRHQLFPALEKAVSALLAEDEGNNDIARKLMPQGAWDPIAFVSFCSNATANRASLARKIQRIEMILLADLSVPT